MSIQYTVPGFELTTFEESPPKTTRPGLPPKSVSYRNILMHDLRCSVNLQVDIFVLPTKD